MNIKRLVLFVILTVGCLTVIWGVRAAWKGRSSPVATNQSASQPKRVQTATIARQTLDRVTHLTAEFLPYQEVDVHAKIAGYVRNISVDIGTRVSAGQVLARLEVPELQDDLTKATAGDARSDEEIARARAEVQRAEAAYDAAHLTYTRLVGVNQERPNLIAQQDVDDAAAKDRVAAAQVATAKASLAVMERSRDESRAATGRVKTLIGYSDVTAPFAGIVTRRYADNGALIQAGTASSTQAMPLVRISQLNPLRLTIPLTESTVPRVHVGDRLDVEVPALGRTFSGTVARKTDTLDPATRTMQIQVDVPNPTYELKPGMTATVAVTLERHADVPAVPVTALRDVRDGRAKVFVISANDVIEERAVTLGVETPDNYEILSGLSDGDRVVVGNLSQVRAGQTVEPVERRNN